MISMGRRYETMTEKQMKKALYEAYQLDWLMSHGYSLADVMKEMTDMGHGGWHDDYISECGDPDDGRKADILSIYDDWKTNVSFSSSIFVCYGEFCRTELTDIGYIHGLIERMGPGELIRLKEAYDKYMGV